MRLKVSAMMDSERRKKIPRQESLLMPEIVNPFVHKLPAFTTAEKVQLAIMSVTIFPLRLLLISILIVIAWAVAAVALYGRPQEEKKEPLQGWRNSLRPLVVLAARAVFFIGGFHWVAMKGRRVDASVAPILALAPHSSYLDALPVVFLQLSTVIAKTDLGLLPFFGTLAQYTQPVFVSREDPNSRQNTIREIQRRAASGGKWPQIIIFPEGTCTNRKCLITFKQGAFIPAAPVQPVAIRYLNQHDTTTWTWDGPGAFTQLWLTLCQVNNKVEIEYLPVYEPNEEEKKDPMLFARNVRAKVAECLGVPVTDHTFEDCRLMAYAAKINMPQASVLVEFQKLNRKLGVNFDKLKELMEKFSKVAQDGTGQVTLEKFAEHLDLPVSDAMREMFELYDRDDSGTIDFREYVIGLHLIARPANTDDTLRFAFQLFDEGTKGSISEQELCDILHRAFGMDQTSVGKIFAQIEKKNEGYITFDEFKAFAEKRPEYARLFTTYQEQKQSSTSNGQAVTDQPSDQVKAKDD